MNKTDRLVAVFLGHALGGAQWAAVALERWLASAMFVEPSATERSLGQRIGANPRLSGGELDA